LKYWLMKSEPGTYSIDDLARDGTTSWEGVRNYRARNNMRAMRKGDRVLFYHSSTEPPGVAGIAEVVREAYPDAHAFDPEHRYYDPKSDLAKPRWDMVDIAFVEKLPRLVTLQEIRGTAALREMELLTTARLSVQAVRKKEFDRIVAMARG
jgi:predicted RNA-binding protein with PUA-like domain